MFSFDIELFTWICAAKETLSAMVLLLIVEMFSFKYLDKVLFPPASNFNSAVFSPTALGKS